MQRKNLYINQFIENIKELNSFLVLLFGFFAYGTPHKYSNLDIFIVLKDNSLLITFCKKQALYLKVRPYIRQIAKQISVDLLVFTIPIYEQFKEMKSNFSKEIFKKGKILYESNNKTVA